MRKTIWEQFAEKQDEFIGGTLIDLDDDPMGHPMPEGGFRTTITGIVFRPNGDSGRHWWFEVTGEDFSCGADIEHLAVMGGSQIGDGLALVGYGGVRWDFVKPAKAA